MVVGHPKERMASRTDTQLANFLWTPEGNTGHACQVYRTDAELLDTLTGYAGGALWNGESVIVVATRAHAESLERRLRDSGLDLSFLRSYDRFLSVSAEALLEQVCVGGVPDAARFADAVEPLVARAGRGKRRVRAYGEMVAILWAQRRFEAAVGLERIWNSFLAGRGLPLLCAYPRAAFESAGVEYTTAVERAHTVFVT